MFNLFRKREQIEPTITTVTADFANGDVLVLSTDQFLTDEIRSAIKEHLKSIADGKQKFVVLEGGLKLSVIRKPQ